RWIRAHGLLDPAHLVFIDETAVSTNMMRLYGRGPRGERVIDEGPQGTWKAITFVAALPHPKVVGPVVVDGPPDPRKVRTLCRTVPRANTEAKRYCSDRSSSSP